jgi:hypothetical protein
VAEEKAHVAYAGPTWDMPEGGVVDPERAEAWKTRSAESYPAGTESVRPPTVRESPTSAGTEAVTDEDTERGEAQAVRNEPPWEEDMPARDPADAEYRYVAQGARPASGKEEEWVVVPAEDVVATTEAERRPYERDEEAKTSVEKEAERDVGEVVAENEEIAGAEGLREPR